MQMTVLTARLTISTHLKRQNAFKLAKLASICHLVTSVINAMMTVKRVSRVASTPVSHARMAGSWSEITKHASINQVANPVQMASMKRGISV